MCNDFTDNGYQTFMLWHNFIYLCIHMFLEFSSGQLVTKPSSPPGPKNIQI